MYENYYAMRSKAFPCQPTPGVFYESPIHKGALFYLRSGVEEHEPFLLVTGEYGMGKTLLALRLKHLLEHRGEPFIDTTSPILTCEELLQRMLRHLAVPFEQQDAAGLRALLFDYYQARLQERPTLAVILDEVQDFGIETLARIRMLSNFNVDDHYPFTFIFFSHPSIEALLRHPQLESLNQRIRRRFHLKPFDLSETKEYIYFRLLESGASGSPFFPDESVQVIHAKSQGIPRFINNICDSALLIGASRGLDAIEPQVVLEAAEAVKFQIEPAHHAPAVAPPPSSQDVPPPEPPEAAPPAAPLRREGADFESSEGSERATGILRLPKSWRLRLGRVAIIALLIIAVLLAFTNRDSIRGSLGLTNDSPAPAPPHTKEGEEARGSERSATSPDAESTEWRHSTVEEPRYAPAPSEQIATSEVKHTSPFFTLGIGDMGTFQARPSTYDEPYSFVPVLNSAPRAGEHRLARQPLSTTGALTASMGQRFPFSLLVSTAANHLDAIGSYEVLAHEGLRDIHIVKLENADGTTHWNVYQGFYADAAAARDASRMLQLKDATVVEVPYTLRIVASDANRDGLTQRLKQAGHFPYTVQTGGHADTPLVGAFANPATAKNWQKRLADEGVEAVPVSR